MNIDAILAKMTLKEKIALCSGANFWQTKALEEYGIPSLFMCDGPHGLRKQENVGDMLGRKYVESIPTKGQFTMDNSVMEMKDHSLIMKIMYKATESVIAKGFGGKKDYDNPDFRMMMAASAGGPLRSMQISGGIKGGLFKGLLHMANGHFFKGIKAMMVEK